MRRLVLIIVLLLLAGVLPAMVVFADHETHDICEHLATGEDFGRHVAEHGQDGDLNGDMNPGVHHQGYSICVP